MSAPEHNPYTPPGSRIEEPEQPQRKGRKPAPLKGLLAGLAVDIGGTLVLSVLITFVYSLIGASSGETVEQMTAYLSNLPHDSWLFIGSTAGGCGFSFLGGYVGARVARALENRVAAVQAVISVATGLWLGSNTMSFGMQISLSGLSALLIVVGARRGAAKNRQGA